MVGVACMAVSTYVLLLLPLLQRTTEAHAAERQGLQSENAALRKALQSLEVRGGHCGCLQQRADTTHLC
jgi:hypothetical protein